MILAVAQQFVPRVRRDEPMARHTSWHVGGPAELWFAPADREDLSAFLGSLEATVPIHWVGLGSNLLVRDGGLRGVVIATHGSFSGLERSGADGVQADSGVPCARVARHCIRWQLGPAEFFAGIPGTIGGALAMNAGAFGEETWTRVAEVETIDRRGAIRRRAAGEYRVGYRKVEAPAAEEWFLSARFVFEPRPRASLATLQELLVRRRATQPIGEWSCGSVFANPPGDHAARLIEASGLKGYRLGGATVSRKHANFIINEGEATARDLERLIAHVQATVERLHGVRLVPEVRMIGEDA
jgi:UDP-N-acetylmuramate dehydrogenase